MEKRIIQFQLPRNQALNMGDHSRHLYPMARIEHLYTWNGLNISSTSKELQSHLSIHQSYLQVLDSTSSYLPSLKRLLLMPSMDCSMSKNKNRCIKCTLFPPLQLVLLEFALSQSAPSSKKTVMGLSARVDILPFASFGGT